MSQMNVFCLFCADSCAVFVIFLDVPAPNTGPFVVGIAGASRFSTALKLSADCCRRFGYRCHIATSQTKSLVSVSKIQASTRWAPSSYNLCYNPL